MAAYHEPMTHRASSSAFAWGTLVYTDYKSGCLRKILLQSKQIDPPFNPKYGQVGALNEERHQARLKEQGLVFEREYPFEKTLTHGVKIRGHMDFVVFGERQEPLFVDELKSMTSTNSRRKVIRNGEYVVENLAQLVCYMSAVGVTLGRLIYTFYDRDDDDAQWEPTEERIFRVDVDEFGRISVDSKPTKFTVHDLYAHQALAAKAIAHGDVLSRPYGYDAPFVSPCAYCVFKSTCDAYDQGLIEGKEAFVNSAKQCLQESPK